MFRLSWYSEAREIDSRFKLKFLFHNLNTVVLIFCRQCVFKSIFHLICFKFYYLGNYSDTQQSNYNINGWVINQQARQLNSGSESSKFNTQKNSRRIANTPKNILFILFIRKFNYYMKNQILNIVLYLIVNQVRLGFDMLVFNIKQANLEYILRRTKQNLRHATPIQTKS